MNAPQQLALGLEPIHHNQYFFSDHYLNFLLPGDPRWAEDEISIVEEYTQ